MGRRLALALLALAIAAAPCLAQDTINIHFSTYGYESGGFEFSAQGDTLVLVGFVVDAEGVIPGLPYSPSVNEYTIVFTDLVSGGEGVEGGVSTFTYTGGVMSIYQDPSFDGDWEQPHEANQPPASFVNGELWLRGEMGPFDWTLWRDMSMGVCGAIVQVTGGLAAPWVPQSLACGGTMVPAGGFYQAIGYDLQLNAEMWRESVAIRASSLGAIKALY
ncbi:MAG: hypothetical protein H6693_08610 [Candidatus Latescibacteria bacterium]|nr:hypothetical protein [bacterium]MCB9516244.1 hypothetical protein [Candidatus Latescibacterota bacterium]